MKGVRFFILSLFCISFLSCKYDLVQPPTTEPDVILNASDYANTISNPTGLKATHGGCKKVTLTWDILPNAIQYQIFSAETPFDTFIQVAETPDNSNEIEISEKAGVSKYYAIKAVNYFGKVSGLSKVVMGSTIANPVITSIESGNNGTTSTVNWWMENCNTKTYQNSISYIITCFEDDRSTVKDTKTAQKGSTSVIFDNLKPHTNYFYQVEAFLSSAQDEVEKSDMLDAETARRLIPRAPVNFTSAKGLSANRVELTWKLPEFVDVSLGTNSFEQHPIYFTIERKLSSEAETKFVKLVTYLGTVQNDTDESSDTQIKFNCSASTSTSQNITLNTADAEDGTTQYPEYKPGTTITWADTTAKQGLKYTYRIRSYTDDVQKTISSDDSVADSEGWKIGNVSFFATARYTDDPEDENKIKSAKINFDINFETFDVDYKYYIVEQRTPFATGANQNPTPDTPTIIKTCNTQAELKNYSKTFSSFPDDICGDYKYSLIITQTSATSSTDAIITINSLSTIKIQETKSEEISLFTVDDGYKDKFILNWNYAEGYKYKYKFIPKDKYNDADSISTIPISNFQHNDTIATLTIASTPETIGKFALYLLSNEGIEIGSKVLEDEYSTLGTAAPTITSYEYDKIIVSWNQVQHTSGDVDDYSVEAILDGETGNFANQENTVITKDENNIFTCTITNPKGYNNYSLSGKPITLKITSQSSNQTDTTVSSTTVRTLGPALTDSKVESSTADSIVISWKEIEGADSYIIYRPKYSYEDFNAIERADKYFVKKNGNNYVAEIDGATDGVNATVNFSDGRFTLTDTYKQDDSNGQSSYKANQAELSWGIPFGYIVIPAKDVNDFNFDSNSTVLDSTSKVKYSSIAEKKGATYGYARNLTAEKAANGTIQKLTWDKPYNSSRTPYVFRRESGTNGAWEYVEDAKTGTQTTSVGFEIKNEDDLTKAYDYIVRYNTSTSTDIAPSYLKKIEDKKDSLSPTEPLNKGYLLNIDFKVEPGFASTDTSANANYYRIRISWKNWDSSKKAVCPTSASIEALNKNLADGWKLVYSLDSNCKPSTKGSLSQTNFDTSDDLIYLTPVFTNDLSNGQLKVLRDIKQYFSVKLQSPNGTANFGTDESIYTYRQITDAEFARCIGLIIAESLHKSGIPYRTVDKYQQNSESISGSSGSFTIYGRPIGAFNYTNEVSWKFDNYTHKYSKGYSSKYPSEIASAFKLNASVSAEEGGSRNNLLYHLPELTITVTNLDSKCTLASYKGKLKFSAGQSSGDKKVEEKDVPSYTKWTLSCQKDDHTAITKSNKSDFQKIFPYELGSSNSTHPEESGEWYK